MGAVSVLYLALSCTMLSIGMYHVHCCTHVMLRLGCCSLHVSCNMAGVPSVGPHASLPRHLYYGILYDCMPSRDGKYVNALGQSWRDFMAGKLPALPGEHVHRQLPGSCAVNTRVHQHACTMRATAHAIQRRRVQVIGMDPCRHHGMLQQQGGWPGLSMASNRHVRLSVAYVHLELNSRAVSHAQASTPPSLTGPTT